MARRWPLILAIVAELGALCAIAAFHDLRNHILAFLLLFALAGAAFIAAWRAVRQLELSITHIGALAVLLRLPMFFSAPSLSDDVWRYLHDGRAQLAGVSPYTYAPADPATILFRGPEHPLINHPDLVTIYPPAAQAAFLLNALAGSKVWWWRFLLMGSELALIAALGAFLRARGHALSNLVLYAWHPLAVVEVVGSAHLEPIGIALMMGGLLAGLRGRAIGAGLLTGLSIGVKFVAAPLLLICALLRTTRTTLAAVATVILAYAIYGHSGALLGSLGTFAVSWQANAGAYALLTLVLDGYRARIAAATLLVCAVFIIRQMRALDEERAGMFMFALLLLSPVVHAWYMLWLLAFIPVLGPDYRWLRDAALLWSFAIALSYTGVGAAAAVAEYLPVFAMLGFGIRAQKKRRSALVAPPLATDGPAVLSD